MNSYKLFETLFLIFLFGNVFLKYYLDVRQAHSIRAHRSAVPPAFAGKISLEAHQKAADYSLENLKFRQLNRLVSLGFILIATYGGLIEWIYLLFTGWLGGGIGAQILIVFSYALISALIDLPFSWYSTFRIEAKYGFNKTTKARFFKDLLLSSALSLILGAPILAVVFWLWNAAGSFWWIWAWGAYLIFVLFVQWVYPAFIAPLFNKFSPLPEGDVKTRLTSLLERIGFASNGLYVMDASKRSAKGNAYMTGFGKNKRIVLFDTLLSKMTPQETEAVLAHELGHYKLHHIYKMMAVSFIFSLIFFGVLAFCADCEWFYEGLGVTLSEGPSHGVALLLFSIAAPVFLFPLSPLTSRFSRKHEFEADAFSVRFSDGSALISALVKLFSDNAATLTPDPLYSAFYSSHPDAAIRIAAIQKEMNAK